MKNKVEDLQKHLVEAGAAGDPVVQRKVYDLNNEDDKKDLKNKILDILKKNFVSTDGLEKDFVSILEDLQCQEERFNNVAIPLSAIQKSRDQLLELKVLMKEIFTEKELYKTARTWYTLWIGTSVGHSRMKDNALQVVAAIGTIMFKVLNRAIEKIDRLELMVEKLQEDITDIKLQNTESEKKHEQERAKHEQERAKHEQERIKNEQERIKNDERFASMMKLMLGVSQSLGINPNWLGINPNCVNNESLSKSGLFDPTDVLYNQKHKADVGRLPADLAESKSPSQSTFNNFKKQDLSSVVDYVTIETRKDSDRTEISEYPANKSTWLNHVKGSEKENDLTKSDFSTIG